MKRYVGYYVYQCEQGDCDLEAPTILRPSDSTLPPGWGHINERVACARHMREELRRQRAEVATPKPLTNQEIDRITDPLTRDGHYEVFFDEEGRPTCGQSRCPLRPLTTRCQKCDGTGWINVGLGIDADPRDAIRCDCPVGRPQCQHGRVYMECIVCRQFPADEPRPSHMQNRGDMFHRPETVN